MSLSRRRFLESSLQVGALLPLSLSLSTCAFGATLPRYDEAYLTRFADAANIPFRRGMGGPFVYCVYRYGTQEWVKVHYKTRGKLPFGEHEVVLTNELLRGSPYLHEPKSFHVWFPARPLELLP